MQFGDVLHVMLGWNAKVLHMTKRMDHFVKLFTARLGMLNRHLEMVNKGMGRNAMRHRLQRQKQLAFQ